MASIAQWTRQLNASLADFAQLAATVDDVDFTYGVLATAVLWPIRTAIQAYDSDIIAALRQIAGTRAKEIIHAVQDWSDDPTTSTRLLAQQAQDNEELKLALDTLISHFDAAQTFAGHLAQLLVQKHGGGDVYEIQKEIKAALVNIGGITNIRSLEVTINLVQAGIDWRVWLVIALIVIPLVAAILIAGNRIANPDPTPTPTPGTMAQVLMWLSRLHRVRRDRVARSRIGSKPVAF